MLAGTGAVLVISLESRGRRGAEEKEHLPGGSLTGQDVQISPLPLFISIHSAELVDGRKRSDRPEGRPRMTTGRPPRPSHCFHQKGGQNKSCWISSQPASVSRFSQYLFWISATSPTGEVKHTPKHPFTRPLVCHATGAGVATFVFPNQL